MEQHIHIYTSLKVDENSADVLAVMFWFSSGLHLRPEEDRSITAKTSTGFSSTFKLVPENCVSYMLQPAEEPPTSYTMHLGNEMGYL